MKAAPRRAEHVCTGQAEMHDVPPKQLTVCQLWVHVTQLCCDCCHSFQQRLRPNVAYKKAAAHNTDLSYAMLASHAKKTHTTEHRIRLTLYTIQMKI
jgi:hypothetical protein